MEPDNEPVFSHSTLLSVHDSKPFECNDSIFNTYESKVIAEENQNGILCHSNSFKESDPVELFQSNAYGMDTASKDDEVKTSNELWNSKLVENFAKNDYNGVHDSPTMGDQKRLLYHLDVREGISDPLASDTKDREILLNSSELKSSLKAEGFALENENEFKNSAISSIAASHLLETDTNMHTYKIIMECELPEAVVSYKEINYHVVKDICTDDGMAKEKTLLTDNNKDDFGGLHVGLPPRHCETTKGGNDGKLLIPDGSTGLHLERDGMSLVPGGPKSASEISFDKDKSMECNQQDLIQAGVVNVGAVGKIGSDSSEEGSFVNDKLPMQEFGTRSFLRSFLNSLNNEEKVVVPPLNQISSGEVISGSSTLSTETEPNKNVQSRNLLYNSKVGFGGVTFNFNSPTRAAAYSMNDSNETVNEQSHKSLHDHQDANSNSLSVTSQVQHTGRSIESAHEQRVKDWNSSDNCSKGMIADNVNEQLLDHMDTTSNDQSRGSLLFARRNKNTGNVDDQLPETQDASEHVGRNGNNVSASNQLQYDDGESSFSARDYVTYSGPIPFSGSLSVRSDSSATSTRSFAFPVLQSEWNSSPVRMAKADRRHFRKRKDWRSGLLCCRF